MNNEYDDAEKITMWDRPLFYFSLLVCQIYPIMYPGQPWISLPLTAITTFAIVSLDCFCQIMVLEENKRMGR